MKFMGNKTNARDFKNLRLCPCCSISEDVSRFYILTDPGLVLSEPISYTLLRDFQIACILRADSSSYRLRFRDKERKANSGISSNFSDQRWETILKRDDYDCIRSQ